jgi:CheY-like chemotaxis protein
VALDSLSQPLPTRAEVTEHPAAGRLVGQAEQPEQQMGGRQPMTSTVRLAPSGLQGRRRRLLEGRRYPRAGRRPPPDRGVKGRDRASEVDARLGEHARRVALLLAHQAEQDEPKPNWHSLDRESRACERLLRCPGDSGRIIRAARGHACVEPRTALQATRGVWSSHRGACSMLGRGRGRRAPRILVIEADSSIGDLISETLEDADCIVERVAHASEPLVLVQAD